MEWLVLIASFYLCIGLLLAFSVAAPYFFRNSMKGPPVLFLLLVTFGWGPFMLWAWLVDGRHNRKAA